MMNAELEGLICSGGRRGKQFTYALLDERAPTRQNAYRARKLWWSFPRRYFLSRGPATVQDLPSGLG